jgi:iron complex transport system permease protein
MTTLARTPHHRVQIVTQTRVTIRANRRWLWVGLWAVLLAIFLIRIGIGSVNIPLDDILRVLMGESASKASWTTIVRDIRLPRAITALLAGASLGVAGLMLQTFFRNPLAGADVLGITSGASLGVALVVLSTSTIGGTLIAGAGLMSDMSLAGAALMGATGTFLLIMLMARTIQSQTTLLILGMMVASLTSALVSLLMYFAIPDQINAFVRWTFGSFDGTTWSELAVFAPCVVVGLALAMLCIKPLNALLLGEAYARSMGVRVGRIRLMVISITALLVGSITAFCGPIGFIGIAVPHVCRSLFRTTDHRILIPATMGVGGMVALIAALIAQVPNSQTILPLNPIMALLGSPVVIWVIWRGRGGGRVFGG